MAVLQLTKTQLMEPVIAGRARESFEHSTQGIFDITAMRARALAEKREPVLVELAAIVPHIRESRVFDQERVEYFKEEFLHPTRMYEPGMFIHFDDNTDLMIDGVHRALAADYLGLKHFIFWMFKESEIIRPGEGWGRNPGIDWGDPIIDGQIVRKT